MKHLVKTLFVFTLACTIAFSEGTVYAADAVLPEGFVIADADGIRASKDNGGYMIAVSEIAPGDVITKIITLRNMEDSDKPYDLYMKAEPIKATGPVNLVEHSSMIIELSNMVVYTGPVDGVAGGALQNKAVSLGTYGSGDTRVVKITITIDNNWKIGYTPSKTIFRWSFYAEKNEKSSPPKTGDITSFYIWYGLMLSSLCILYIVYKRRSKNSSASLRADCDIDCEV